MGFDANNRRRIEKPRTAGIRYIKVKCKIKRYEKNISLIFFPYSRKIEISSLFLCRGKLRRTRMFAQLFFSLLKFTKYREFYIFFRTGKYLKQIRNEMTSFLRVNFFFGFYSTPYPLHVMKKISWKWIDKHNELDAKQNPKFMFYDLKKKFEYGWNFKKSKKYSFTSNRNSPIKSFFMNSFTPPSLSTTRMMVKNCRAYRACCWIKIFQVLF